jgi:hypothetical protein
MMTLTGYQHKNEIFEAGGSTLCESLGRLRVTVSLGSGHRPCLRESGGETVGGERFARGEEKRQWKTRDKWGEKTLGKGSMPT